MDAWVWWLIVAGVFGVAEVLTTTLYLLMFAGGAIAAGVADALGAGPVVDSAVFALVSVALVVFVRPIAAGHLRRPMALRRGTAALIGSSAVVLEQVDANGGRVKVGGEVWSARSFDPSHVIEAGRPVEVMQIDGATAVVYESEI